MMKDAASSGHFSRDCSVSGSESAELCLTKEEEVGVPDFVPHSVALKERWNLSGDLDHRWNALTSRWRHSGLCAKF